MDGGVSATATFIEAQSADGERQRFVLRQHAEAEAGVVSHVSAVNEGRLLGTLRASGLPVPEPRLAEESGTILAGPFVVMDFVDGAPVTRPPEPAGFTAQLAVALANLHNAGFARTEVPFLPDALQVAGRRLGTRPQAPDDSVSETAIRAALTGSWPPPTLNYQRVLHGDYWPGNTLWRDGELVAVIDWEDAAFGEPLADVGNARLELAMAFGARAAREFTVQYRAAMPGVDVTALPYWDLYAALRPAGQIAGWGLAAPDLDRFRAGHREFTSAALRLF
jgi:aminoglycoside phosphotransferase (APT) family kinase protein